MSTVTTAIDSPKSLVFSITDMHLVSFQYNGCRRVVEPHCLGRSRSGALLLRAYQVEGSSTSGPIPGWRLFKCEGLRNLEVLARQFTRPRPDYKSGDSAMTSIYAEL